MRGPEARQGRLHGCLLTRKHAGRPSTGRRHKRGRRWRGRLVWNLLWASRSQVDSSPALQLRKKNELQPPTATPVINQIAPSYNTCRDEAYSLNMLANPTPALSPFTAGRWLSWGLNRGSIPKNMGTHTWMPKSCIFDSTQIIGSEPQWLRHPCSVVPSGSHRFPTELNLPGHI